MTAKRTRILITGGNGFIARNLSERLHDEYSVVSCNSSELNLLDASRVSDFVQTNRFDIVIHTATYDAAPKHSAKDPAKVLEYNLRMFSSLARCVDYFDKMIYFGSGAEFGRENWIPRMREDYFDRHVPADQYGFSKYLMTKYAQVSKKIYNLRLFGVFGKYDDWRTRFIPNACCHAILNLPIRMNQNVVFDYLDVEDLAGIVAWFISNQPREHVYNVCTGCRYDHATLADKIVKLSGKCLEVAIRSDGLGREYSGDNSLLLNELGGVSFRPMDESLRALYGWLESQRNQLQIGS